MISRNLDSQKKTKVLIFIRNYLPGFRSGGPVRSVANIVKALSSEYEFYVVCLNRDHGVSEPYPDLARGEWVDLGKTHVYYAADDELTFTFYRKIFRDIGPDFIYLNSLLDRNFSIKPFLAAGRGRKVPIILAPRGELSAGALGLKAFRKGIFITLAKAIKFYKLLLTKYPEYLATYYHYGKLLEKIGQIEIAKIIYSNGINLSVEMKEHHTASELRQALNSLNDDNLF
jgi:tetratricopeptide (TPR) repeat protein